MIRNTILFIIALIFYYSYNIVTLEIVEAIMKNCSSYFETFCPSALNILFHIFQSPSYSLAIRSLQTVSSITVLFRLNTF